MKIYKQTRSVTSNETGKNLPTKKNPRMDQFIAKFYQIFKEELTSTLLKLFNKIESKGSLIIHPMNPVLL